jgi:hypothetical protein
MLVDKDNLDAALQRCAQAVKVGIRILGKVIPPDDSAMPPSSVVAISFDTQSFSIVVDELTEDRDTCFKGDDEGNCGETSGQ